TPKWPRLRLRVFVQRTTFACEGFSTPSARPQRICHSNRANEILISFFCPRACLRYNFPDAANQDGNHFPGGGVCATSAARSMALLERSGGIAIIAVAQRDGAAAFSSLRQSLLA